MSFLGPAVAITGAYLVSQGIVAGVVGAVIGGVLGLRAGLAHRPFDVVAAQAASLAPSLLLSTIFSSGALIALTLLWARGPLARTDATALGFVRPRRALVLLGLLAGFALGTLVVVLSPFLAPVPTPESLGPLAVAISKAGTARTVWCIFGLFIAPLTEETLFRGVLFTGLRERLTPVWSAAAVTVLFVAVHATHTCET